MCVFPREFHPGESVQLCGCDPLAAPGGLYPMAILKVHTLSLKEKPIVQEFMRTPWFVCGPFWGVWLLHVSLCFVSMCNFFSQRKNKFGLRNYMGIFILPIVTTGKNNNIIVAASWKPHFF